MSVRLNEVRNEARRSEVRIRLPEGQYRVPNSEDKRL
jgi:hypothetical protein